jgi:2-methylcitrate dehydratase PrpD
MTSNERIGLRGDQSASTRLLAEFAADMRGADLPVRLRELLGYLLLDYLRVAAIGAEMPWSRWAEAYTSKIAATGPSSILFASQKLNPVHATFLNAVFAGSIDSDDTHVGSMLHPGAIVFSSAIATSQTVASGKTDFLPAVVAGYESMIRTALSIQPSHFQRGFQSTATCGGLGSAVAAARILFAGGGTSQKIAETLGIAASFAGGLTQFYFSGSTVKRIHAAHAAENGVAAAFMVSNGFNGPADIFEGSNGFAKAYADEFDSSVISDGLGTDFRLLEVTVKGHASSARVQSAIDGILEIRRHRQLSADEIDSVWIGIPQVIQGRLTIPYPVDLQAAQMSLPFCAAMAVLLEDVGPGRAVSIRDFDHWLNDPKTAELQKNVTCELDSEVEAATTPESVPAKVRLRLRSGEVLERFVRAPKGSPSDPYNASEHAARFTAELAPRIGEKLCEEIVAASRDISSLDVNWLGRALAK